MIVVFYCLSVIVILQYLMIKEKKTCVSAHTPEVNTLWMVNKGEKGCGISYGGFPDEKTSDQ